MHMNRKRIADYGIRVGKMERGPLNKITDVPGVRVGHATVCDRCNIYFFIILLFNDHV